ncbi:uncharacterized protein LOC132198690 [Neocloeon triangulifer]|uniref:uncharacterized protein LOC132198690 n=1 Tax=Neocloeon triangulifer TaxID=2078957 RepID=UPI00286ECE51|nr:uncharacterized protein LOC132198690 [Neocloeon triangulifer]
MPRKKKRKVGEGFMALADFKLKKTTAIITKMRSTIDHSVCEKHLPKNIKHRRRRNKRFSVRCIWVTNLLLNKGFKVDFEPTDSVRKVKTYIESATGIPWQKQILLLSGKDVLQDTDMMQEVQVYNDKWRISVTVPNSFDYVSVRDKSDKTHFVMEVNFNKRVSSMYNQIRPNCIENNEPEVQFKRMLFFHGRVLEPDQPIKYYHLKREDEVTLVRYPNTFPRQVFIETGGRHKGGVRVGPFFCDPQTSIYDLKVRFINTTCAPKGHYRMFAGGEEVQNHYVMAELGIPNHTTFRLEMAHDQLTHMKPTNYIRPVNSTATAEDEEEPQAGPSSQVVQGQM